MIDFLMLAVLAAVTWCVASDGTWGAATVFLSTFLAGLIAMNVFEPLAATLEASAPGGAAYWDIVALLGVFTALVFGFRAAGEYLMPTYVDVHGALHNSLRWILSFATGYVVVAVLMTSLHTAPLPRSFLGFNPGPASKTFFGIGPDIQWLALNQYVSERGLRGSGPVFDAVTFERIPGQQQTVTTFSSFPIRYAMRRSMYISGASTSSSGSSGPPSNAPPP
ncbi:MAG: CvpA family protein, partial [Planctomycetaceae bacterium]|nr:CvpA family protein [Planctomycetaceae bacterium]